MRRSGITTLSASAWVSIPNGPSARVEHTISGPFTNRNGSSAASRPRVTASFEFGLTTRIRRWVAFIEWLAGAPVPREHHRDVWSRCKRGAARDLCSWAWSGPSCRAPRCILPENVGSQFHSLQREIGRTTEGLTRFSLAVCHHIVGPIVGAEPSCSYHHDFV